jgi:hypothetical protein
MAFDVWSFVGGNVTGAAAMHAVGRVFLKGAELAVRDQSEDRWRLTGAQRKPLDEALVVVTDTWTAMLEEGADKLWEELGGTNRGMARCRILETGTEIKGVKLEMSE